MDDKFTMKDIRSDVKCSHTWHRFEWNSARAVGLCNIRYIRIVDTILHSSTSKFFIELYPAHIGIVNLGWLSWQISSIYLLEIRQLSRLVSSHTSVCLVVLTNISQRASQCHNYFGIAYFQVFDRMGWDRQFEVCMSDFMCFLLSQSRMHLFYKYWCWYFTSFTTYHNHCLLVWSYVSVTFVYITLTNFCSQ